MMHTTLTGRFINVFVTRCFLLGGLLSLTWGVSFLWADTAGAPSMPVPVNEAEAAMTRWLEKPVWSSMLLDNMENAINWTHRGFGEMSFTRERCQDGVQSIRLISPTSNDQPNRMTGRPSGEAVLLRHFPGDDWSDYNRLSFWVYPNLPGFKVISLLVKLHNEGEMRVPDGYGREGLNYVLLKSNQWNHVVWEIPHLARDKVTGVSFTYRLQGNEPDATNRVCFDFDRLELQRVKADYFEGWAVAPGRIAFSHTGYSPDARKTALTSGHRAGKFQVVRADTAKVVAEHLVRNLVTRNGTFQELDFSEVREPGPYVIRIGDVVSHPFRIDDHVWRDTVWKTINFFHCERCGFAIPGIHAVCHQDWQATHNQEKIVINGGWHDAGDLSQGAVNTSEAAYAMLSLADHIQQAFRLPRPAETVSAQAPATEQKKKARTPVNKPQAQAAASPELEPEDTSLSERLIEEAKWGLAWLLKTRFGDGSRVTWATMDYWTDGVIGTADDTFGDVRNSAFENYLAASTEAMGARVLRQRDPALAAQSLTAAKEDWRFAVDKSPSPNLEIAAAGLLAALELYKTTSESDYANKAMELAEVVMSCQQKEIINWRIPLSGFFYTNPRHERLLHYSHRGHEQAPIVGLAELCTAFPAHRSWMRWYTTVVLHSEYLRSLAHLTEPYDMLANGIYSINDSSEAWYQNQLAKGIALDNLHCIRLFPAWTSFRGNHGTVLSQTKALSAAAQLRQSLDLASLSQMQLQWVVGRNPFGQSTMFGEGYDYAPQYTALSGDMVGSLPVGIQTRGDEDQPYWPAANCYNYKEVWVHPSARWLWLMNDLDGPARVSGVTGPKNSEPIEFREVRTGRTVSVKRDYRTYQFTTQLPEGRYLVRQAKLQQTVTLLPGSVCHLDLRNGFECEATQQTTREGKVVIQLNLRGSGTHRLVIRTDNLIGDAPEHVVDLVPEQTKTVRWQGKMAALNESWVAVIVPDDNMALRQEVFGSARLR